MRLVCKRKYPLSAPAGSITVGPSGIFIQHRLLRNVTKNCPGVLIDFDVTVIKKSFTKNLERYFYRTLNLISLKIPPF